MSKKNEASIGQGGVTVVQAEADETALTVMGGGEVVQRRSDVADGQYVQAEGKMYSSFLKIAYGVGEGAKAGLPSGAWFFHGATVAISGPKKPLTVVILKAAGFWKEWTDFKGGNKDLPREFATEDLAKKAGLVTRWAPYGSSGPKRNCAPAVDMLLLVQEPEGGSGSPEFTILLDGKLYAPARSVIDKKQYEQIEKMLALIPQRDAALRRLPPNAGRTDAFPVTLTTTVDVRDDGKTLVNLALNFKTDANDQPVRNTEKFFADLAAFNDMLAAASAAPVPTEDAE